MKADVLRSKGLALFGEKVPETTMHAIALTLPPPLRPTEVPHCASDPAASNQVRGAHTQRLTGSSKQTQRPTEHSKQTHRPTGHSKQTHPLTGHSEHTRRMHTTRLQKSFPNYYMLGRVQTMHIYGRIQNA